MKKIVLSLMLAVSLAACGEKTEAPKENEKPVVKIGSILPLTGASAEMGNELKNAALKMLEQYKDSPVKYELIFEDNQGGSVPKSISAMKKMIYVDKISALIPTFSAAAQAIAPIIEDENLVQFALVVDLDPTKYKKSFSVYSSVEEDVKALVEILKKQNVKKIACFVQYLPAQMSRFEYLQQEAERNGIEIVKIDVIGGNRNFNMDIAKMSQSNPDMIVLFVVVPELDIIAKQLKDLGVNIPKTTIEAISHSQYKEDLFENSIYVEGHQKEAKLINDIKEQIKANGTLGFVYFYESLAILTQAIDKFYTDNKRIPTADEIVSIVEEIDTYQGIAGEVYRNNHRFFVKSGIRKIVNGQPVVVEE